MRGARREAQGVRRPRGLVVIVAAVATLTGTPTVMSGQQPAQRAQGTVQAGVNAVLVDVVVRDKKGEPVRDLKQSEIQLTEDGVPQTIASFAPVFDNAAAPAVSAAPAPAAPDTPAASAVGAPPPVDGGPTVTTLVFDRLTPEARDLAVKAAQNYLGSKPEAPGYVGIFGIDLSLAPLAPFTRNTRVLRQGLDKIAQRATANFDSKDARDKAQALEQAAGAAGQGAADAVASAGRGGSSVGGGRGDAMLAQMQADMIRDFDAMEREESGYSTTNGLFAIVDQMRRLPGRKSLILFSEGIAQPPAVQRLFAGVIDAANRANVAIYTMDAAGLRADSEQAKIRDQVNAAGAGGGGILSGGKRGGGALTQSLENNEDVLRQDPRNSLSALARDTGGVAFDSTNNLRQGFERVESDLHNYYLIGYTPTNEKFDGKFRTIDVKVSRPGVTVAARRGYFGVRDTGGAPVNTWEAPALGALESKPVPNNFPVRAVALLFPEAGRPGLVPVIVDLKTAPLSFPDSGDGKTYASDFAVLVRFLDARNQIAKKVSQHYQVRGPLVDAERAKQGEVLFYREPELQPGVYSMETIVYDNPSGKASVRFATVEVPKVDPAGLRVSSLMITGRAEKVPERDRRPENPLLVNDTVVYPNLGEPVSKKAKEVGFFVTVYPARDGVPEAVLDLLSNGKPLAQLPLPLAAADAQGRIQQAGRLPIDQLAPGTYELQVLVKQGTSQIIRTTTFRIVE
jgi:VWFA-related protein